MGVHIHDGILLSHEKEWNNVICSNMDDLEIIILSDKSQLDKCVWCHLLCSILNMTQMNRRYWNKHRKQTSVCQGGGELRDEWSGRLTDVSYYIEWINKVPLLYSTGNYIQHPAINLQKRESHSEETLNKIHCSSLRALNPFLLDSVEGFTVSQT